MLGPALARLLWGPATDVVLISLHRGRGGVCPDGPSKALISPHPAHDPMLPPKGQALAFLSLLQARRG